MSKKIPFIFMSVLFLLSYSMQSNADVSRAAFQDINNKIDAVDNSVNETKKEVKKVKNIVSDIQDDIEDLTKVVDAIDDRTSQIESDLDECCQEFSSVFDITTSTLDITTSTLDISVSILDQTSDTLSIVEQIEDKVCVACDFIITSEDIFNGSGVFTISVPGVYCLAENVSNLTPSSPIIEIVAQNVVLDLHGHTITTDQNGIGIQVTDTNNVVIKNGTILGAGIGVYIYAASTPSTNIRVQDLAILNSSGSEVNEAGLFIENSTDILVQNCQAIAGAGAGFKGDSSSERCTFKDCIASDNSAQGFSFAGSSSMFSSCQAKGNEADGFDIEQTATCNVLESCIACSQLASSSGFKVQGSDHTLKNCTSTCNEGDGFIFVNDDEEESGDSSDHVVCDCIALNNTGNGFFATSSSSSIKFMGNKAQHNDDDGFLNSGDDNIYLNNCACNNNDSNFNGTFVRRVVNITETSADINFWDNVDCDVAF